MNDISFTFYFNILAEGVYDPNKITKSLSIEPTKKWVIDTSNKKPLYNSQSGWQLSSIETFKFSFDDAFSSFLVQLESNFSGLEQLVLKDNLFCSLDVVIQIYNGNSMPGINISYELMTILSTLKCSLDFDIYDYRSNKLNK